MAQADRHLTYSFARINAALKMKVEDLRPKGAGWQLRLHEKGGKHHEMPCHHALAEELRAYIDAAGIAEDRKGYMRRFTRLTNAFTKKAENHAHAVALHFMHYNFCKIHMSLKSTPAMRAGVVHELWDVVDIVRITQRQPGPCLWSRVR
jgi:integrase